MNEIGLRHFAYLGDAVWELFVRERTILQTPNAGILHKITTDKVKSGFQAQLLEMLEKDILTEEEKEIARRGRNLPIPIARRSNQKEYRLATAFETLIGWWYYNDNERLKNILQILESCVK